MLPRSPGTPGSRSAPARVPRRTQSPRWPGSPYKRPPTDAELVRQRRRTRSLARFACFLAGTLLLGFALAPLPLLHALAQAPPALAPLAARAGWWLQTGYPFIKVGLLAILCCTLLHLVAGAWIVARQVARRRTRTFQTLLVDLPRTPGSELGRGVDLFAGIGDLLGPAGQLQGREDSSIFALVNAHTDNRVRLVLRMPACAAAAASTEALRNLLSGVAPGTTTCPAPDDLETMLQQCQHPDGPRFVGYADYTLARQPPYPIKDLALFVGGDPLGPLAAALSQQDGVSYVACELIIRAVPPSLDWRGALRERIGQIQGAANPEDLVAYETLVRKVEHDGFDVVVRCIAGARTRAATLRQLRAMHHVLQTFSRPAGEARQHLLRAGSRLPGRAPGFHCIPLTPETAGAVPLPAWGVPTMIGAAIGALAGTVGGMALARVLPRLQGAIPQIPIHPPTLPPDLLAPVLSVLCALAGLLVVLALSARQRTARQRARLATLRAHAHRPVWPGARWTAFPVPARHRAILGPYELAALWHPPSLELEAQFAWRSSKYLPAPPAAFLPPHEAQHAQQRQILPRPATPQALGACRLGIAYARQRNGELALIGPTLRDLRQGWDTMGSTGSGKSSLIETMVYEIARIGGGCGVIDAKGDLADRLLRILPPESYDRVVVIDTTATMVPCINPFDRRIIGARPRDVVAGEIGEIFARIEPEIWAGAIGMQQALLMSISAILEGEREPSLLHLQRFLLSPSYRGVVLARAYDRSVRDYWLKQVPRMPEKIKTSIESLKRRIDMLIGSETGQQLLCQPQSTIDLGAIIRNQGILIIKFVPERIGHTNAAYWSAVIFQSIISATFQQQVERDPEQRWDWPLFIDEVQMFVRAERAEDAERMWTRTRSMGVGLIGAHQGLNQLGEKLGGIVLNVIGGMCLTSGVRDDARSFVDAYAHQGLQVEDFTGIKAREELMIRFPVAGRDMGAISAIPRKRPAEQPAPAQHQAYDPPPYTPRTNDDASALALLDDLERGVAELQARIAREGERANAPAADSTESMFAETVYRAVANRWLDGLYPTLADALRSAEPRPAETQLRELAWGAIQALIRDLRAISTRRAQSWADALATAPAHRTPDDYLTRLSQYRYGVNPIVNACFAAALVRQYETDELTMARQERRSKQRPNQAAGPPPQIAPPSTPRSAVVVPVPAHTTRATPATDP